MRCCEEEHIRARMTNLAVHGQVSNLGSGEEGEFGKIGRSEC